MIVLDLVSDQTSVYSFGRKSNRSRRYAGFWLQRLMDQRPYRILDLLPCRHPPILPFFLVNLDAVQGI